MFVFSGSNDFKKLSFSLKSDKYRSKLYIRGTLKNGKLHGIVQIFGILSRDPHGHCAELIKDGLSFIGWYENGTPTGVCWRQLGMISHKKSLLSNLDKADT